VKGRVNLLSLRTVLYEAKWHHYYAVSSHYDSWIPYLWIASIKHEWRRSFINTFYVLDETAVPLCQDSPKSLQASIEASRSNTLCCGEVISRGQLWWESRHVLLSLCADYFCTLMPHGMGRDSWVGIATLYGLDGPGSNPGGGEIFRNRPDRPWSPTSLLRVYIGYRVFPGLKAAGAWRWPPLPSSAEVKERVELYLYSPSRPSRPVLGWTLPLCRTVVNACWGHALFPCSSLRYVVRFGHCLKSENFCQE
jgi:hypothetical protein